MKLLVFDVGENWKLQVTETKSLLEEEEEEDDDDM